METEELKGLLSRLEECSVGVIGDFCVDAYWDLDTGAPELSVETGKPTEAVRTQRYSLGGAGNIVANLSALGVGRICAFAVIGDDPFGRELRRLLEGIDVDCRGVAIQEGDWGTSVYAKPHVDGDEQGRLDFGRFNRLNEDTRRRLIASLEEIVPQLDALIVNQQILHGLCSGDFIDELNRIARDSGRCRFIADSRDYPERFESMIVKVNAREALMNAGGEAEFDRAVPIADLEEPAERIRKRADKPVFITRGSRGILAFDGGEAVAVPGIQIIGPTDPVGAGDTVASALAACLAAEGSAAQAAYVANLAAGVTVQKLQQTGTASPEEILDLGTDTDFVYNPELAEDPRRARHLRDSEIEIVNAGLALGDVRHAVFDHDGTISTLRQGWEAIMEPVMIRCILGARFDGASEDNYLRVVERVRRFIDQSTGIQTIVQMQGLAKMVREFGFVPEGEVLTPQGYKDIYNNALMAMVDDRTRRIERGELDVSDYTLKGAVDFLHSMRERGVTLYLASGTDEGDVKNEAALLGYADLFEGGIFGAVGDISKYSKKMVIDRIIRENDLSGPQLACFGDGPVEMRETRKRGGVAIGIASDEVRRFGLCEEKRSRLIRAGADIIVPDFSQRETLLGYLFGEKASDTETTR